MNKIGIKQLNVKIDDDTMKKLKIIAVKKEMKVKEIIKFLIRNFIESAE
jgi:hypothetical protein